MQFALHLRLSRFIIVDFAYIYHWGCRFILLLALISKTFYIATGNNTLTLYFVLGTFLEVYVKHVCSMHVDSWILGAHKRLCRDLHVLLNANLVLFHILLLDWDLWLIDVPLVGVGLRTVFFVLHFETDMSWTDFEQFILRFNKPFCIYFY